MGLNDEQKRTLPHIRYEIAMLAQLVVPRTLAEAFVEHALLESAVLHCRVLCDFYGPRASRRPHKDDAFAEDYGYAPKEMLDDATRERMNKLAAHLTLRRTELLSRQPKWQLDNTARKILEHSHGFAKCMLALWTKGDSPDEQREWEALVKTIDKVLASPTPMIGTTATISNPTVYP